MQKYNSFEIRAEIKAIPEEKLCDRTYMESLLKEKPVLFRRVELQKYFTLNEIYDFYKANRKRFDIQNPVIKAMIEGFELAKNGGDILEIDDKLFYYQDFCTILTGILKTKIRDENLSQEAMIKKFATVNKKIRAKRGYARAERQHIKDSLKSLNDSIVKMEGGDMQKAQSRLIKVKEETYYCLPKSKTTEASQENEAE